MANYQITAPDGTKYQVTAPDDATQEQVMAYVQSQHQTPQPEGSALGGTAQAVGNTLLGAVNAPIQGLAGIAGAIKGAVTPGDSADNASERFMQAATIPQFGSQDDGLKTQAARQALQGAVGGVVSAIPTGLDKAYTAIRQSSIVKNDPLMKNNPEAGDRALLNVAGNVAPLLLGRVGAKTPAAIPTPEMTPFRLANEAGYRIMPSEAAIKGGSAPVGKLIEGLAGSAKTGVDATVKNQAVTNRLASQEIGIKPGTPLTQSVLDNARAPHNAVYAKVAELSKQYGPVKTDADFMKDLGAIKADNTSALGDNPDISDLLKRANKSKFYSDDLVKSIKSLRKNAASNYKASNAFNVKNANELGDLADAQKSMADAFENLLDRYTQNTGAKGLIQQWQNARQSLAKINTVDNSIKEGTTDVSAPMIARQLNKGAPLSGNLKTIADTANAFPISVRDITAVRNKVPINALEGFMGTGGVVGQLAFGEPHAAAIGLGAMLARPAARSALLSKSVQKGMLPNPLPPELQYLAPSVFLQALATGNQK